jgi:hypothetical protein
MNPLESPVFRALAREAAVAAEHMGIGITALGNANYAQTGYYAQAFFALTVGLERACKLAFLVDYAVDHGGAFPANRRLLDLGHRLDALLALTSQVASRRGLLGHDNELPDTEIHRGVIKTLTDFANNTTRYYNLDLVTGASRTSAKDDALSQWFNLVTTPILDKHYLPRYRDRDEENARRIEDLIGGFALVRHVDETGQSLDNVFDASRMTAANMFAKRYERMYVMQICRFVARVVSHLGYLAQVDSMQTIPYLSEFFAIFNNSDAYFRRRKTWSIYHP